MWTKKACYSCHFFDIDIYLVYLSFAYSNFLHSSTLGPLFLSLHGHPGRFWYWLLINVSNRLCPSCASLLLLPLSLFPAFISPRFRFWASVYPIQPRCFSGGFHPSLPSYMGIGFSKRATIECTLSASLSIDRSNCGCMRNGTSLTSVAMTSDAAAPEHCANTGNCLLFPVTLCRQHGGQNRSYYPLPLAL